MSQSQSIQLLSITVPPLAYPSLNGLICLYLSARVSSTAKPKMVTDSFSLVMKRVEQHKHIRCLHWQTSQSPMALPTNGVKWTSKLFFFFPFLFSLPVVSVSCCLRLLIPCLIASNCFCTMVRWGAALRYSGTRNPLFNSVLKSGNCDHIWISSETMETWERTLQNNRNASSDWQDRLFCWSTRPMFWKPTWICPGVLNGQFNSLAVLSG